MAPRYPILLAEDHVIFQELIKKSLKEIPDLEVVGEVRGGLELGQGSENYRQGRPLCFTHRSASGEIEKN